MTRNSLGLFAACGTVFSTSCRSCKGGEHGVRSRSLQGTEIANIAKKSELHSFMARPPLLGCLDACRWAVLSGSAPRGCFVQTAHPDQLEGHRRPRVVGVHQVLAVGDHVILRGGRRIGAVRLAPGDELARLGIVRADRRRAGVSFGCAQTPERAEGVEDVRCRQIGATFAAKKALAYVAPPAAVDFWRQSNAYRTRRAVRGM